MARKSRQEEARVSKSSRTPVRTSPRNTSNNRYQYGHQIPADVCADVPSSTTLTVHAALSPHSAQAQSTSLPSRSENHPPATNEHRFGGLQHEEVSHRAVSTSSLSSPPVSLPSSLRTNPRQLQATEKPASRLSGLRDGVTQRRRTSVSRPTSRTLIQPHASPLVEEEERESRLNAKAAKARKDAQRRADQEAEKAAKKREILWLLNATRPAPSPCTLRLPNPPPRQNVTGRFLPISLLSKDHTFPLTNSARELFVATLLDSMRDIREAEDTVSLTTDFKDVWLKPGFKHEFGYDEVDMERVCRELVSIAETLHTTGLGSLRIYCPRVVQKAVDAKAMSFKERIDKLALLMRKSKSRCDSFMLGNTMEDTIALIGEKLAAQRCNAANNKNRSLKLEYTNQVLGMEKGSRWFKTDGRAAAIPAPDTLGPMYATPDSMALDDGVDDSNDGVYQAATGQADDLHDQSQVFGQPTGRVGRLEQDALPYWERSAASHLSPLQPSFGHFGSSWLPEGGPGLGSLTYGYSLAPEPRNAACHYNLPARDPFYLESTPFDRPIHHGTDAPEFFNEAETSLFVDPALLTPLLPQTVVSPVSARPTQQVRSEDTDIAGHEQYTGRSVKRQRRE